MENIIKKSIKERFEDELLSFRLMLGVGTSGVIESKIKDDVAKLLDLDAIQILENRYQLGLLYKVTNDEFWREAKHTRLDHTIGVIAKCIVASDIINKNTSSTIGRYLTETDVRELAVAALLHDFAHFPISHATERAFHTAKGIKSGVSHEERISTLILTRNPILEDLREIVLSWDGFNEISFYRIYSIINPKISDEFVNKIRNYTKPKLAIQQLLVSDIDMDRLDYIIRDSKVLNYSPVIMVNDKIAEYVKSLSLEKSRSISFGSVDDNAELCLTNKSIESVFYLLVSRVLLYKYVYFSKKVRSFEAILTYLIGTFLEDEIALEPLKLIIMPDEEFIEKYLDSVVDYIDVEKREHIRKKYVNVLKKDKVERFQYRLSINAEKIGNHKLREEFIHNINKRSYIDKLRDYLYNTAKKKNFDIERSDILLDVFHIKTGGGGILVKAYDSVKNKSTYKTLKDYMNGSNMHRLCSETRLDIYVKSDVSDKKKDFIKERIVNFFRSDQDEE